MPKAKVCDVHQAPKETAAPIPHYFHSVSIPQLLSDDMGVYKSDKIKNCKYEMHVLYYIPYKKVKNVKDSHGHIISSTIKDCLALKRRRFMLGKNKVTDVTNGAIAVNPLTLKGQRTRNKCITINGDGVGFDKDEALKMGGFLSKKFWQANLIWGSGDSMIINLAATSKLIRAEIPMMLESPHRSRPDIKTTPLTMKLKKSKGADVSADANIADANMI